MKTALSSKERSHSPSLFFFHVKTPSSCDETAAAAASVLISLALAKLRVAAASSSSSSVDFKGNLQRCLPASVTTKRTLMDSGKQRRTEEA